MLFSLLIIFLSLVMLFYGTAFPSLFIVLSSALVPYALFNSSISLLSGLILALVLILLKKRLNLLIPFAILFPFVFFPELSAFPFLALKGISGIVLAFFVFRYPVLLKPLFSLFAAYLASYHLTKIYYFGTLISVLIFSLLFLFSFIPGRRRKDKTV